MIKLFEKEDDYSEPIKTYNFWNNNYIDYKSNSGRNKKPSVKEYEINHI